MSIGTPVSKDFGEHEVEHRMDIDETGEAYRYYECTECGHEHVSAESFKHVKECV